MHPLGNYLSSASAMWQVLCWLMGRNSDLSIVFALQACVPVSKQVNRLLQSCMMVVLVREFIWSQ